ncbi:MmgE/PrpD family protein [Nocardioides sp. NPDC047086]|uniref:MmgE/PrpD family protein n=1 Tax=Nocardioides sp. NPDC047086 TaxID=3154810 RepID=UPI0033DE2D87
MTAAPTAARALADWAVALRFEDLHSGVRHAVCRHLLDGVGNAVGGRRLGLVAPARAVAEGLGGPPEARVLTGTNAISAPAAALATGALVHALDFDDTHGQALVHATSVVLPTALAVGQQTRATGAQVVTAAAAGLETACRIGAAVPHGFHARGIHATAAVGPLAASVTAGLLLGLGADTIVDALGVAGSSSGGLLEFLDTGADTKTLHPGTASMAGIVATRLAAAGARGPDSVLEGRRGLWATLTDATPDVAVVTGGLGERWEATRIGIKPYPSCQLMHVSLDALAALLGEVGGVEVGTVARIEVHVHPDSIPIVCEQRDGGRPRSTYDAKFDLAWSVAALLIDGAVTVDTYTDASIARPEVAALAQRVEVVERSAPVPAADAGGDVRVVLSDGTTHRGTVASSRGTAATPLSDDELVRKLVRNTGDHPDAVQLGEEVLGLAEAPSLDRLLELAAHCAIPRP